MKKLVLIAFLVSSIGICQKKNKIKADETRFEQLVDLAEQKKFVEAADGFKKFMTDFPNSNLKPRAHYNLGEMLWQSFKVREAASVFKEILDSDYDETEAYGGIMEQYALYKNRSASNLSEIYFYLEKYDLAEKYLSISEKDYPYQHFCGNELMADKIGTATMYGKIYLAQGKTDEAIAVMVPHLFDTGLASNSHLLAILEKALQKRYTEDELKAMVKQTVATGKVSGDGDVKIEFAGQKLSVFDIGFYLDADATRKLQEFDDKEFVTALIRKNSLLSKYL